MKDHKIVDNIEAAAAHAVTQESNATVINVKHLPEEK